MPARALLITEAEQKSSSRNLMEGSAHFFVVPPPPSVSITNLLGHYDALSQLQLQRAVEEKEVFFSKLQIMLSIKESLEQCLVSDFLLSEEEKPMTAMHSLGWMGVACVFFSDVVIGEGGPFAGMFTLISHLFSYVFSASLAFFSPYGLAAVGICSVICIIDCIVNYAIFGPLLKNIFGVSSSGTTPSLFTIQRDSVKTTGRINSLLVKAHLEPSLYPLLDELMLLAEKFNQDIVDLNKKKQPYVVPLSTQLKESSIFFMFSVLTAGNAYFVTTGFLFVVAGGAISAQILSIIIFAVIILQVIARLISRMPSIHHLFNPEEKEIKRRDAELKKFFQTEGPEHIEKLKDWLERERKLSLLANLSRLSCIPTSHPHHNPSVMRKRERRASSFSYSQRPPSFLSARDNASPLSFPTNDEASARPTREGGVHRLRSVSGA